MEDRVIGRSDHRAIGARLLVHREELSAEIRWTDVPMVR